MSSSLSNSNEGDEDESPARPDEVLEKVETRWEFVKFVVHPLRSAPLRQMRHVVGRIPRESSYRLPHERENDQYLPISFISDRSGADLPFG